MQINNNYQPSFGKVIFHKQLSIAIAEGKISAKRLEQIRKFQEHYDSSDINVILGLANADRQMQRLDAQVFYRKPNGKIDDYFSYKSENLLSYALGFSPKKFLNKVGEEVRLIAESFCVK